MLITLPPTSVRSEAAARTSRWGARVDVQELTGVEARGGVDEEIQAAESGAHGVDRGFGAGWLGQIDRHDLTSPAHLTHFVEDGACGLFGGVIGDDDVVAGACQPQADRAADTHGSASHERDALRCGVVHRETPSRATCAGRRFP